ncbi:ribose 5-phosphate isomerase A [Segetibacter sp.]|jgi:ribose 5-phosphate isomerase A|uniref:ribose 5-phosphate isomerase A n=1 Tax=Segetibacter sp. TaxID=2231182 RepID=UPI00261696F3|nr:ribose 5-phosphate isomerase A [Segetibacter sp.]MCW3079522.1 rpiA [Segetibacter sp.]
MDLKMQAAQKAATLVEDNTIVGLGAGSTIAYLAGFLELLIRDGLDIRFVTSSFSTTLMLQKKKLPVYSSALFKEMDIYFDGCDQLDKQLNALKSGGGIHTHEKLLASMAKQFVLIGDETKLVESFDLKYPVVLEILPQSVAFVPYKISQLFKGTKVDMRMTGKDGPVITENGNYLIDVYFEKWPDLSSINPIFKSVSGIVETSLFYRIANKAVVARKEGVIVLER